jgi:voltage-gated potassium channel Kch
MARPLAAGDRLIVIAQDDDTIRLSATDQWNINLSAIRASSAAAPQPEKTLILGWNWRGTSIINELDNYVAPGSEVTVVAAYEVAEEQIKQECDALKNQQILFQLGETANRRVLDSLQIERFDRVIVLCYADALEMQQADAQTLITLLHLRDIADKKGLDFAIISEMLDVNNRALAEVARADDFVVSDKLISLMLAQVSENKSLNSVFSAIFSSEGSEIYLKPVTDYVKVEGPLNFYTILEAAAQRDEVAIGYRLLAQATDATKMYGVVINPQKSGQVQFADGDRVIVLANS